MLGHWKVENISTYYSFLCRENKLFGSKSFSIVKEEWLELKYTEEVKQIEIISHISQQKLIAGVNSTPATKSLIKLAIRQARLPENGRTCNPLEGFIFYYKIFNLSQN
jgi:hypothetical protein